MAAVLTALGCGQDNLSSYAPRGPSAKRNMFMWLAGWPCRHFAVEDVESERADYEWEVDYFEFGRPGQPTFRSLCALVNTYFQDWDRLVIIERVGCRGEPWHGYIVLGCTPDGFKAVTNLEGRLWDWKCRLEPRRLRVDGRTLSGVLDELDRFEESTKTVGLLWFEARDWPLYVLHDLRRTGRQICFGVRAYRVAEADWAKAETESSGMGWDEISDLLDKNPGAECVRLDSPRGFELMKVGARYAPLIAAVWDAIMGIEDKGILGPYEELTPTDPSAEGVTSGASVGK